MNINSKISRIVTWVVMFTLVVVALPCEDLVGAIIEQQTKTPAKAPLPPAVRVNRTIPKVTPIAAFPVFSKNPSDEDIIRARVFEEPLVPFATGNENENRALSAALLSYLKG